MIWLTPLLRTRSLSTMPHCRLERSWKRGKWYLVEGKRSVGPFKTFTYKQAVEMASHRWFL